MSGLSADSLLHLRDSLPPYPGAEGAGPSATVSGPHLPHSITSFCRYYGIDFSAGFPRVRYRYGSVASGDFALATHCWLQPGADHNLLLLHGYFDHVGLYGKLIEYGLSRNCNVLAFDLPGHGLSTGAPAAIATFAAYSRAIEDVIAAARLPELPFWVMAQSTGAAALIDFARHYRWPFMATVLLAPLLRPARWWQVNTSYVLLHKLTNSVRRRFSVNSSDREFLEFIQRDPLQARHIPVTWVGALRQWLTALPLVDLGVGPALVVQGTADRTVAWRYNILQLNILFPGARLELLPEAGHQLANESAAIREHYLSLVTEYVGLAGAAESTTDSGSGTAGFHQKTSVPR